MAGRRGGKTLSAAWEITFYCLHHEEWWKDYRPELVLTDKPDPLHVWVLVPNFKSSGRAAMRTLGKVFQQVGLVAGTDYKWNRGDNFIEFNNGAFLEFKTSEQADQLIGAGIHLLWMDEAATIPSESAYEYASPALDDNLGGLIATTTPRGKNWYYETFWGPAALKDHKIGSVEYRSLDNPYFPVEAWVYRKQTYHPLKFKQEFEAAFDSMSGKELSGDWLSYYEYSDLPLKNSSVSLFRDDGTVRWENVNLDVYIGIDPAISLNDRSDFFGVSVVGVSKSDSAEMNVFLLDTLKLRIPFPEQVELLQKLHYLWRPMFFGVDATAYQAALVQQASRLSSMPPIVPVYTRGRKKSDRILSMAPVFKIGRVKVRGDHRDFIEEWVGYDSVVRNPHDDLLDATEMALSCAGILLPSLPGVDEEYPASSMSDLAQRLRKDLEETSLALHSPEGPVFFDENLGEEW